jgi:hypothetical protein
LDESSIAENIEYDIKIDVKGEHFKDTKRIEMPQDGITI